MFSSHFFYRRSGMFVGMARRAPLGLARVGSFISNGSGDFVIAFSTQNLEPNSPKEATRKHEVLYNDEMGPLFLAVVEAVEESVYNALLGATSVEGRDGRRIEAISLHELRRALGLP